MRDVTISAALNGYICVVGCKTVVFTDRSSLLLALKAYLDDPQMVVEKYLEDSLNSKYFPSPQLSPNFNPNRETGSGQGIRPDEDVLRTDVEALMSAQEGRIC